MSGRTLRRGGLYAAAFGLAQLFCAPATAAPARQPPLGPTAKEGLKLAKSGDCVAAVPVLERAEAEAHRPVTASALADCHVALGEILLAHEIFDALAREDRASAGPDDKKAIDGAAAKAKSLDARIPRVTLVTSPEVTGLEVRVGGRKTEPLEGNVVRVPPDEKTEIEVRAEGYEPAVSTVLLTEGEAKTLRIELTALEKRGPDGEPNKVKPTPAEIDPLPPHWIGARFRGLLVPEFVMNLVGDGGTTTYWPGAAITYTARLEVVDIEPTLMVTSYALGTTPFKPHDTPDTEWELVESDLWGLTATVDILYRVKLDDARHVELRIGGGFGVGWAFTGELYRWQSYPASGEPGDPAAYEKCVGPNNPAGTFRYCNQLDKDAERYGAPDATWFTGGARPVVYPWLSLPQIGLSFRPVPEVAIDLEIGLTLNGLLTGLGLRFGVGKRQP
ncbi:MAG: hypothetical protein U0271_07855 [Polyangiaceae bacterium]